MKLDLLAKVCTQLYRIDCLRTFSPVENLSFARVIPSVAANFSWPLYQLDKMKAFLHGVLLEEIYVVPLKITLKVTRKRYVS